MAALTNTEVAECVVRKDPATKDFFFQQTMLRIKDPKISLKFYSDVLGMRLVLYLFFYYKVKAT